MSWGKPNPALQVYFIRPVGAAGPIKIGCTKFTGDRLDQLMQWSPVPLEIAAVGQGDFRLERFIHGKFSAQRLHKEWFRESDELLAAVARISAGASVADAFGAEARMRKRFGQDWLFYVARTA